MKHVLTPTADPDWIIAEDGYDPLREASRGSRFAISNGFLGMRGTRAKHCGEVWAFASRTLVAGLFDTPDPEQPIPALVATPDWLQGRLLLHGKPLVDRPGDGSSHRRTLDMRRGMLVAESRLSSACGLGVRLRSLHLVSLGRRAIGLQLIQLEIEDADVEVTLEASFAGTNGELVSQHVDQDLAVWRTVSSSKSLAMAVELSLHIDGHALAQRAAGPFHWSWSWRSRPGQVACFERMVAVTCGGAQSTDPGPAARQALGVARRLGWRGVVAEHEAAWVSRWELSDTEIEGDPAAQQGLRFALYHLNSAANPADESVSIAARALTGDDYRGHVFWDTEIFLLPFYTFTWPEAARALLMYRFNTLDAARAKAQGMGWRGALYAWESADTGAETTPPHVVGPDRKIVEIKCGKQEQHISADVAYAIWQYWQVTGDDAFLLAAGAEIILETGRFWASRAQPEADGLCHIRGVIGPDEYHEDIDDNAFTNVMARWTIRRALEVAASLRDRWPSRWASLSRSLGLGEVELEQWRHVAATMATGLDRETGLFEQFLGFFALEEVALAGYAGRSVPMDVILGRERTQRSQVIKQADVVALLALLPDEFPGEAGAANFRYYAPRCGHGSSLSTALHGLAAARLGNPEAALGFFRQTSAMDLADTKAAIDGGVHIASLGGLWMIAVLGFAGLSAGGESLAVDPRLPPGWRSLGFRLQWRGRRLTIRFEQAARTLDATLEAGEAMTLVVGGKAFGLHRESPLRVMVATPVDRSPVTP